MNEPREGAAQAIARGCDDATSEVADRDPPCFSLSSDDSSRNVTGNPVPTPMDVEAALADALARAAAAQRFDIVAQLARELEARRLARAVNVISIEDRGRGRR